MADPIVRVDFSSNADFSALAIDLGLPMLDKGGAAAVTLTQWLGRFAAEPVWEGDKIAFFLRDDQGGRLLDVPCRPASVRDLRGELQGEFAEFQERIRRVSRRSAFERTMHKWLVEHFVPEDGNLKLGDLACQFFKYRDAAGRWRLVWCAGYRPSGKTPGRHVICQKPTCHQLVMADGGWGKKCSGCRTTIPGDFPSPRTKALAVVTLLLMVAAGVGVYLLTRPSAILAGRVVRALDGQALAGATVGVEGTELEAVSEEDGFYELKGVPDGTQRLAIAAPGYEPAALPLEVAAHQTTAVDDVSLRGAGRVMGKVVRTASPQNQPVSGAAIALDEYGLKAESEPDGHFAIENLPPGEVHLAVTAKGFRNAHLAAEPVADGAPLTVVLSGAGSLGGTVVWSADGKTPIAGAEIAVEDAPTIQGKSDKDGRFQLAGVPPTKVNLLVSARGFRQKKVGVDPTTAQVTVPLAGDATIVGSAVRGDNNNPVANADIRIAGTPLAAQTGSDGKFRLEGVPSGRAQITATAPSLAAQAGKDCLGGKETSIRLVLTGGAKLTGRVVNTGDNAPLAGAEVAIADTQLTAKTDAQGKFTLAGIPAGSIALRMTAADHFPKELTKELAEGDQSLGDTSLDPAAVLQGQVTSAADQKPVAGAAVRAGDEAKPVETTTDAEGRFTLPPMRPGATLVMITADDYCPRRIKLKELPPGAQALPAIAMMPAATLNGSVVGAFDRQPIVGAQVRVPAAKAVATTTDSQGRYSLAGIPAAKTQIEVQAEGHQSQTFELDLHAGRQKIGAIALQGEVKLRGAVFEPGEKKRPVAGAKVTIALGGGSKTVVTAANGGFEEVVVPAGSASFSTQADGFLPSQKTVSVSKDNAWVEIPMTRLVTVAGVVYDAVDNRPIAGAEIEIRARGQSPTATSGADGRFTASVPPGAAVATVKAKGYCQGKLEKELSAADPQLAFPLKRGGTLQGKATNAINKHPVALTRIEVEAGGVTATGRTDGNGAFSLDGVPAGGGTVRFSADGFEDFTFAAPADGSPVQLVLSPEIPAGEIRFVLTWGERPRDIDGHLYGPSFAGTFHVFFDKQSDGDARLDVDSKTGFGPETITAHLQPGTYQYYVAHGENQGTSNGQPLGQSGAQVRLYYKGAGSQNVFVVPAAATGPVWHVLDVVVDQNRKLSVVPRNQFSPDVPK